MWNRKVKVALIGAFGALLFEAVLALSTGTGGGLAPRVQAAGGCGLQTLHGGYGNSFTFLNQDPANAGAPIGVGTHTPGAGVGVFSFDGRGNFSGHGTLSASGFIIQHVDTGTYTVNTDCTGSLDLTFNSIRTQFDIVIVDHGDEVFMLATEPGGVAINRLRKQ